MTIVIKEMLGSRSFAFSGTHTASRNFIGYDDEVDADGVRIIAEAIDIMLAPEMPSRGQSHPDASLLFADTYNMTPSEEGTGVWEVSWDYTPTAVGSGGDNPLQPDEESNGYVGLTVESNFTIVDIYQKVDKNTFTNVNKDNPGVTTNIGGTLVALMGNPISKALPTTSINITQEIVATTFDMSGILKNSGKRNASPWLGLDAGSVVFAGISVARSGVGKYKLTWKFVWDEWFHLRQIPEYDINGKVVFQNYVLLVQQEAYWRQPFPETVEFGFQPEL